MHSPIEPGSPTLSTPTSESDVEEVVLTNSGSTSANLPNIALSSSKRRLNQGVASNRDPKSRRRDQSFKILGGGEERPGPRGVAWDKEKKEKDELLDMSIVEFLRKEIGDPFAEISFD